MVYTDHRRRRDLTEQVYIDMSVKSTPAWYGDLSFSRPVPASATQLHSITSVPNAERTHHVEGRGTPPCDISISTARGGRDLVAVVGPFPPFPPFPGSETISSSHVSWKSFRISTVMILSRPLSTFWTATDVLYFQHRRYYELIFIKKSAQNETEIATSIIVVNARMNENVIFIQHRIDNR